MRSAPTRVTSTIVIATTLAWALAALVGASDRVAVLAGGTDRAALLAGFIPARVAGADIAGAVPAWLTPLSALLVHAGLLHLMFNMLMLGYCGRAVETALGGRGMALLYGVGAYAAAGAQYLAGPHSEIPVVGASGAASAVIAAYALLYGQRRAVPDGWPGGLINILWLAAAWIGLQLLVGLATSGTGLTVALAEHVGGFVAGLALARPLLLLRYRNA